MPAPSPTRRPGRGRCRSTRRRATSSATPQHAANLFALAEIGNVYTRIMNPTQAVLEGRAQRPRGRLHDGRRPARHARRRLRPGGATLAVLNLAGAGDHIVSSSSLYGGTYNLFHYTFPKLGIEVTFVDDPDDLDQWRAAVRPTRSAFYGETIPNPKNDVFDIEGVAGVAHEAGIPLIIDNTVPTPYLIRPIEWGADIVVHSLTKFLGGHGTSIGGAIIDGGTFDSRPPAASPASPSPTRATTASPSGPPSAPARTSSRPASSCCATSAPPISPFNAFLILQGIETLSLRMERHFAERPEGRRVPRRPGPGPVGQLRRAARPARGTSGPRSYGGGKGYGSVLAFEIEGGQRGRQAVRRGARAAQPRRQHRRRPQPRHPPGEHDAQPAHARGAAGVGRRAGPRPPQRRPGVDRRHPRRPRPGLRAAAAGPAWSTRSEGRDAQRSRSDVDTGSPAVSRRRSSPSRCSRRNVLEAGRRGRRRGGSVASARRSYSTSSIRT